MFGVESWVWKVRGSNVQQPFHMSSSSIFNFLKFIWSSKIVNNCNFWISVHQFKFERSQFQVRICTGYFLSEWFINPKYIIKLCWIFKLFVWKLFKSWGSISCWERSICFALFSIKNLEYCSLNQFLNILASPIIWPSLMGFEPLKLNNFWKQS